MHTHSLTHTHTQCTHASYLTPTAAAETLQETGTGAEAVGGCAHS